MSEANPPLYGFKARDVWRRDGRYFYVTVMHWTLPSFGCQPDDDEEERVTHRWNVYAKVGEGHPLFSLFLGAGDYDTDFVRSLPLPAINWYRTLRHPEPNPCTVVEIGNDYGHYGQEHLRYANTPEKAREVFRDAAAIFDYLSAPTEGHE